MRLGNLLRTHPRLIAFVVLLSELAALGLLHALGLFDGSDVWYVQVGVLCALFIPPLLITQCARRVA